MFDVLIGGDKLSDRTEILGEACKAIIEGREF